MAHADRKRMGAASQGKHDGSGALSEVPIEVVPANMVLSNRDKAQMSGPRGQDGKWLQSEQMQDHDSNRETED
jgi:hypothetical protein